MPAWISKSSIIIFTLLLSSVSLVSAQPIDYCDGIADELVYNQQIEASITDTNLFGRYCFAGRAGDEVIIQVITIEGDLVLSGALSDSVVDELYEEFATSNTEETISISFTLPEDESYLLFVSRENFGQGTSSGSYRLSLSSDNEPVDSGNNSVFPETIENYAEDWSATIAELQLSGAINTDGGLIFSLENAFSAGSGSFFTPIARDTAYRDIVVSAELSFNTTGDSLETCSILSRVVGNSPVERFLEAGIDSNGDIFWVDAGDRMNSGSEATSLDLNEPQHLLLIAQANTLTIYLNGQRLLDNIDIASRSGSFGIALLGQGAASRCEAINLWAYAAPRITEGLCEASPASNINRRAGASTAFQITGIIESGDFVEVIAQSTDGAGLVWYQLVDSSFVREDVVSLAGDCDDLQIID